MWVSSRETEWGRRAGVSERKGRRQSEEERCWIRLYSKVWSHTALQWMGRGQSSWFVCSENRLERKYSTHFRTDTSLKHSSFICTYRDSSGFAALASFWAQKPALFRLNSQSKLIHTHSTGKSERPEVWIHLVSTFVSSVQMWCFKLFCWVKWGVFGFTHGEACLFFFKDVFFFNLSKAITIFKTVLFYFKDLFTFIHLNTLKKMLRKTVGINKMLQIKPT